MGAAGQGRLRQASGHRHHPPRRDHPPVPAGRALLSQQARQAGCYPSFATHDVRLITEIATAARDRGWAPGQYEFETLHGVRPDLQRAHARQGHRIRAYLPFGTDWFPYAIRRIGESPRNARFALTAITRPPARSQARHDKT